MIELQRHIEILLLENDCVIVPGFGGFITHQLPARYDENDRVFLPPLRTLGFNPQLRMNDSVLVQSYVEAYDISYPEAMRRIEQEVSEMQEQLNSQGHYVLEDLGELSVNQEGNYEFTPCEAGILSPSLYGLGAFTFKRLKDSGFIEAPVAQEPMKLEQIAVEQPKTIQLQETATLTELTDSGDESDSAINISMSWVRNAVAIAAAVVAFFLIATPVTNSNLGIQTMSQLQHSILYKLIPQDTNVVPAAQPVVEKNTANTLPIEDEKTKEETVLPAPSTPDSLTYCVVVASQVKLSNAELFVAKLQKEGYKDAKVFIHHNIVRVICGEFKTKEEAIDKAHQLHNKEEYAEAWVYKKQAEV